MIILVIFFVVGDGRRFVNCFVNAVNLCRLLFASALGIGGALNYCFLSI